ncbi:MAG: methyltransferase domain-containing protein [Alphaproteobacteria bacterium]|nr:methyltransferase domain-containing protein [Alphaproteobacteria bacterium]
MAAPHPHQPGTLGDMVMPATTSPWCCPVCRGDLSTVAERSSCRSCANTYPVIAGIPDLRVDRQAWINFEHDRKRALEIEAHVGTSGLESAIRDVFRSSRGMTEDKSSLRTRQVLKGVDKCSSQIQGWLEPLLIPPAIEIGCGPGQLLAAAARHGKSLSGLDVSLEWLVIAKHLARANGGDVHLAAGMAERLPLQSSSMKSVISLDVIEHVGDQPACCQEIIRVLAPEGRFGLSTPNRFSLSPEPHVGVWGVGYLPVALQPAWVKLVSGQDYAFTRLLSRSEMLRLFAPSDDIEADVVFPEISDEDIALFTGPKAKLARLYNQSLALGFLKWVLPLFGAYYRVQGRKLGTQDPPIRRRGFPEQAGAEKPAQAAPSQRAG